MGLSVEKRKSVQQRAQICDSPRGGSFEDLLSGDFEPLYLRRFKMERCGGGKVKGREGNTPKWKHDLQSLQILLESSSSEVNNRQGPRLQGQYVWQKKTHH